MTTKSYVKWTPISPVYTLLPFFSMRDWFRSHRAVHKWNTCPATTGLEYTNHWPPNKHKNTDLRNTWKVVGQWLIDHRVVLYLVWHFRHVLDMLVFFMDGVRWVGWGYNVTCIARCTDAMLSPLLHAMDAALSPIEKLEELLRLRKEVNMMLGKSIVASNPKTFNRWLWLNYKFCNFSWHSVQSPKLGSM